MEFIAMMRAQLMTVITGALTALVGVVSLIACLQFADHLTTPFTLFFSSSSLVNIDLVLCGCCLLLLLYQQRGVLHYVIASLLISVICLVAILYGLKDPTHLALTVNFILIDITLLLTLIKRYESILFFVCFIIFSFSLLVLFSYTYQVDPNYVLVTYTRMPVIIAFVCLLWSVSIPLLQPSIPIIHFIIGKSSAGKISRNMLINLIFLLLMITLLENIGERFNLYDPDFGDSINATLYVALVIFLFYRSVKQIAEEEHKKIDTEHKLDYLKLHDVKTSLLNRDGFEEKLKQTIANNPVNMVAVIKLTPNQFELINNVYGRDVANNLLGQLALQFTSSHILQNSVIALLDADTFGFIVAQYEKIQDIALLANQLLNMVSQCTIKLKNHSLLTASVGISIYPDDGNTAETLLTKAATALSFAKKEKGNAFKFSTSALSLKLSEQVDIENSLQAAINENQFELYYQPQLDLKTNQVIGAETLLRWHHPKQGMVSPAVFMPIAEETGLIIPITEWILKTICVQLTKENNLFSQHSLVLAVNLSSLQFNSRYAIVPYFESLIKKSNINPALLDLEITESVFMHDTQHNITSLAELKKLGFKIALDDFGTGFSSFSYICRIPFDKIKIDKSFIDHLPHHHDSAAIVKAMIVMFHQLHKKVVAEGVENEAQFEFLKEAGCDIIQGNYFSQALPFDAFESILKAK